MKLFAIVQGNCCNPIGNRLLFGPSEEENDNFRHELNLIVEENGNTVLLAGCAHRGIINIMRRTTDIIGHPPSHVFTGMHLLNSGLTEKEEGIFINELAHHLMAYKATTFYTIHCTGTEQYYKLKTIMGKQIHYLSCGDHVII